MKYETFLETVKSALEAHLGNEYTVILSRVSKNNGVVLDGLTVKSPAASMAPTIYLNDYYTACESGLPLETILKDLLSLALESPIPSALTGSPLASPEQYMDKIIYRLINAPANERLLSDVPHILYEDLDLALTFYILLESSKSGQFFSLIHNSQALRWNLSTDLLYQTAHENTHRLLPPAIAPLTEVVQGILQESLGPAADESLITSLFGQPADSPELYVLSNTTGINGSCCLFYDSIIKDFADRIGSDLVILPSSIHEVLLTPDRGDISYEMLRETVFSVNREELPESEQLSNHVYCYRREDDRITVALRSPLPLGNQLPFMAGQSSIS